MLVMQIGCREAARRMGLSESTVMQWSARGKWLEHVRQPIPLPSSMQPTLVSSVSKPADALCEVLKDHERETTLSLARAARRNAAEAETAGLDAADKALATGKLLALVHRWERQTGSSTTVNALVQVNVESH